MSAKDKLKTIDKIISAINNKAGRKVIDRASNMTEELKVEFIPTPSLAYNKILCGGFARKRITEIAGDQSSGKTSILLETIALDHKNDPESIWGWLETENSLDKEMVCDVFGIDPDRFIVWNIDDSGAEFALDILESLIRSNQFKGFVVNSVTGLTPAVELESEMAKANIALQARMMSKLMRKITAIISKNNVAMIFTNQLRTDLNVSYGDNRVTTGGKALPFYASQRVIHSRVKLDPTDGITENEGMKIRVKVKKNRLARKNPFVSADYLVRYGKGVDIIKETADLAREVGLVEGTTWLYYPNKETAKEEHRWQGIKKFLAYLEENPDFLHMLREEINKRFIAKTLTDDEIKQFEQEDKESEMFIQSLGEDTTEESQLNEMEE
ncbi:MAG: DNA recombination/repair protein RecA [Ignavibacterium sp.]|nr:DNA recombination/repair protein RecA [Ignavibacterium sp.]